MVGGAFPWLIHSWWRCSKWYFMEVMIFLYTVMDGHQRINKCTCLSKETGVFFWVSLFNGNPFLVFISYRSCGKHTRYQGHSTWCIHCHAVLRRAIKKKVREDIEAYSQRIYLHSCRISENSVISVSMPCTVRCQQHWSNHKSSSVADDMKKDCYSILRLSLVTSLQDSPLIVNRQMLPYISSQYFTLLKLFGTIPLSSWSR